MNSSVQLYKSTMKCNNVECLGRVRVGRELHGISTRVGALAYCPICGGKAFAEKDIEEDYWEVLAEAHNVSVEIIKLMYDTWNRREFDNFYDHVNALKKEAADEE